MKGAKFMAVIGAILGDIAGSQFEFNRPENLDYKHCELFTSRCSYTDDTGGEKSDFRKCRFYKNNA